MEPYFIINLVVLVTLFVVLTLLVWKLSNRLMLNKQMNLTKLFLLGAVSFILIGGFATGNSAIDIQLHDTYFVIAHAHILMGTALIFAICAGFYYLFPVFFKREINETMGKIHFTAMVFIVCALYLSMRYIGIVGVPRRYYQVNNYDAFASINSLYNAIAGFGIAFALIQIIPFINAIYSLIYGKRIIR